MHTPELINSLQVVDTFFPVIDGVVQTVHNYASIMSEDAYSGVLCPKPKGFFNDGTLPYDILRAGSLKFPYADYSVAWPLNPHCVKRVRELCVEKNIQIVHFHSPFTQRTSAVIAAKELGLPMVATFHTKYYDDIYHATKIRPIAQIVTDSIVRFYNKCDCVWACSQGTAETLRSYGYKGEVFVMPNGTNITAPDHPDRLKSNAARIFKFDSSKNNLLFVGTQVWQKNLKLVLDSFRLLCEQSSDYYLTVVGSGSDSKAIMNYAKKLGLSDAQIRFTGRVEDRDLLAGIFLNADLFFFPSLYDNAPLVLREASILETPALLVEGSNSAEVIIPDVNGYVASNDPSAMREKITAIFNDKEAMKAAGVQAKETIPVPWRNLIPMVYEKYAEIIDKKKSTK